MEYMSADFVPEYDPLDALHSSPKLSSSGYFTCNLCIPINNLVCDAAYVTVIFQEVSLVNAIVFMRSSEQAPVNRNFEL